MSGSNNQTQSSAVASALGLESNAVGRYVRFVTQTKAAAGTLRLFEHPSKKQYALHGTSCIALAAALRVEDPRAPDVLPPATREGEPLETLILSPRAARDLAAAALFSAGKKVVLYCARNGGSCELLAEASPGNVAPLTEYMDLDSAADALPSRPLMGQGTIVAIKVSQLIRKRATSGNVGVVVWDPSKRTLSVAELHDDDSFAALEAVLVAVNAMELLVCENDMSDHELSKLDKVLESCGAASTTMPRRKFSGDEVATDLERLVGSHLPLVRFLDMNLAMQAVTALLSFQDIMSDVSLEGAVKIAAVDHASFMQLDTAAMRALNVVPFTGDGGGGKLATLFGLLNKTKTPMGSRLMRQWIAQPLQDITAINARLDAVGCFYEAVSARGTVRDDMLNRMPDLHMLIARFIRQKGAKATLQDVVRLYQSSVRLPYLVDALRGVDSARITSRYVEPLDGLVKELANFEALVETTIDLDQIDNGEFVISPKIDSQLAELRVSQDGLISEIADEHQRVINIVRPSKDDALKLEKRDNQGYVFRVTRKDEKLIRDKSAFIVLDTRKDGVRFVSSRLKKLSARYSDVAREYGHIESELRAKTIEVASTYMELFGEIAALVAEVDALASFATVASSGRGEYTRPNVVPAGNGLVLKQARHPMVEECLDDGAQFIANDMDLRRDKNPEGMSDEDASDDGGALLIITGPNTGGKSTYIRSAGVITLMAHIGCYVPAESATVPITDRILCRVGAGDNQHRAVSTFMSEMLETATILRSATKNSLIIIDELGRGTGVSDGYGLAHAISHHIATELKAPTLFATHFHELTALADKVPAVRNLSVTALTNSTSEGITFLYGVKPGACGQSFGVHVAEMARFPGDVVRAAKRKLADLEGQHGEGENLLKKVRGLPQDEVEEGERLLKGFVAELKKLPLAEEAEKQTCIAKVAALRESLVGKGNSYVQCLLSSS